MVSSSGLAVLPRWKLEFSGLTGFLFISIHVGAVGGPIISGVFGEQNQDNAIMHSFPLCLSTVPGPMLVAQFNAHPIRWAAISLVGSLRSDRTFSTEIRRGQAATYNLLFRTREGAHCACQCRVLKFDSKGFPRPTAPTDPSKRSESH